MTCWEAFVDGGSRVPEGGLLLLMILGRAQRGGPFSVFRFRDLDQPLAEAIAAFGAADPLPDGRGSGPLAHARGSMRIGAASQLDAQGGAAAAFWALREAGFWEVQDEARFASERAPERQALLDADAAEVQDEARFASERAPERRALLDADAAAEVPAARWEELRGDPARTARLIKGVLVAGWPAPEHGRLLAEVVFDLRVDEEG